MFYYIQNEYNRKLPITGWVLDSLCFKTRPSQEGRVLFSIFDSLKQVGEGHRVLLHSCYIDLIRSFKRSPNPSYVVSHITKYQVRCFWVHIVTRVTYATIHCINQSKIDFWSIFFHGADIYSILAWQTKKFSLNFLKLRVDRIAAIAGDCKSPLY